MIGIVSHDLRNPLSVVMLATHVLATRSDQLDEKSNRMLANITRAGERAQRLIDDLLDFTVARLGKGLTVSVRPVDLNEIADRAVEELGLAYPGRSLRHVPSGQGRVSADAHRLNQLLGNLVSNAMAYGDPAGVVTVSSGVVAGVARLSVHNTGPVIPPAMLAAMFEPMVRGDADGSATRSVGLGLFIVRAIAAAHGGDMSVASSEQVGTTFSLAFPAEATG